MDSIPINLYRYTTLVDFVVSNGFLGLFLAAIFFGGIGLGVFYMVLCILSWYLTWTWNSLNHMASLTYL